MITDYERGRFDALSLIASVEYGKQCYFLEDNGIVYFRRSCKYMTLEEAFCEFLKIFDVSY